MVVTPIYASCLAVLYVVLSLRVIRGRRGAGVALGDGGNLDLFRRQRVHGNFAEYTPLVLILMALAELQAAPQWSIHLIGAGFSIGRCLHALGLSRDEEKFWQRVTGMALTFAAILTAAILNLTLHVIYPLT